MGLAERRLRQSRFVDRGDSFEDLQHIRGERSGALFSSDDTLLWLKEIIGYLLNKIDSGDMIDKDIFVATL